MVGYALMMIAPGIAALLPAVVVRSLGAATLWVYSTLLLQYRVENRIQGARDPCTATRAYVVPAVVPCRYFSRACFHTRWN